ncbi:MAG: rRNA maturation RNase YbeY [Spirochaetes bacterium]|nr:rRNA maturation RNase YbeY [Spirochaetota bacterium]
MAIKVNVEIEHVTLPKSIASLCKKNIVAILHYLHIDNVVVTLIFTNDEAIAQINSTYRKKKGPTDVISFAYREAPMPSVCTEEYLGDIFISLETAQKQATEYGITLKEELQRLVVHGVLHILGYDHEKSAYKKKIMQKKEKDILDKIQSKNLAKKSK